MTKESLMQMGLTEEQANKVMESLNGAFVPKSRFNEVNTELQTAKNTIKERDTQLETLQKSASDNNALREQIAQLQTDNDNQKNAHDAEMKALRIGKAVDMALTNAKAKNNTAVKALLAEFLRKAELASDRATVAEQMQSLIDEKVAVQQAKHDAEAMLEKAYDTAAVCSQILSDEKHLNQKFLEFLDREGQRTNRPTHRYVEHLYEKYQKERRENLSDWQLEMLQIRAEREQVSRPSRVPNIIDTGSISDCSPSL